MHHGIYSNTLFLVHAIELANVSYLMRSVGKFVFGVDVMIAQHLATQYKI